jgi:hypothetical protein
MIFRAINVQGRNEIPSQPTPWKAKNGWQLGLVALEVVALPLPRRPSAVVVCRI